MMPSDLPPGVTGNEPMIAGYDEFEFACATCDEELWFSGDRWNASADCSNCGEVWIVPEELLQSQDDEREIDAKQDDRL